MQNFRALGAPPPDPHASGGWGLCPQTPSLRQLGASPPDPHWPPAAGGSAPRPPKQPPPLRISGYAPAQDHWFQKSKVLDLMKSGNSFMFTAITFTVARSEGFSIPALSKALTVLRFSAAKILFIKKLKSCQFFRKVPEVLQKFLHCNVWDVLIRILMYSSEKMKILKRSWAGTRSCKPGY